MSFGQLFAKQSKAYALSRPTYPQSLYQKIFAVESSVSRPKKAVDIGCGSGQATIVLAEQYDHVIGIDPSEEQLAEALKHPKITYVTGSANQLPLGAEHDSTVDLVTIAQAFHWFEFPQAFREVNRILKPETGVAAIWCYLNPILLNKAADDRVNKWFYHEVMGKYWSLRRRHIDNDYIEIEKEMRNHYGNLQVIRNEIVIQKMATIQDFISYVSSWSAYQTYREKNPDIADPLEDVKKGLCQDYGANDDQMEIEYRYPVSLFLGTKPKKS